VSVGAPLQIATGLEIESKNGATFGQNCSGAPTDATNMRRTAMTMISHLARCYYNILQQPPQ
jgi:hypothetical protein